MHIFKSGLIINNLQKFQYLLQLANYVFFEKAKCYNKLVSITVIQCTSESFIIVTKNAGFQNQTLIVTDQRKAKQQFLGRKDKPVDCIFDISLH